MRLENNIYDKNNCYNNYLVKKPSEEINYEINKYKKNKI
jgi:hypothetical protein